MRKPYMVKKLAVCLLILTMAVSVLQFTAFAGESAETSESYDPNWDISMDAFGIIFHLSEEDYSLFVNGNTEKSLMSLERMGWTPEEIQTILANNNAIMELFPITARSDYTNYIVFVNNWGTYDAQGKNLEQLYEDPEAAEAFRQYVYDHINDASRPTFTDEGVQEIGIGTWQKYSYTIENNGMFMAYLTVLRDSILWVELKYWDEEQTADMCAVMEDILEKTSYVINVSPPGLDPGGTENKAGENADDLFGIHALTDELLGKLDPFPNYTGQKSSCSYDCIQEFPFYMNKELLQQALEEQHLEIYKGSDPNIDELYVFRDFDDHSTWQTIYEFNDKEQLVSVTMPLIAEGFAEAFTGPFLRAKAYYQDKLGDYEISGRDSLELLQEDPAAFMESLSSDSSIRLCWEDAFDCEGSELYLMFMELNGNPSVYAVYFSPETAPNVYR